MSEEHSNIIEDNKEMLLDILENVKGNTEDEVKCEIIDCLSHFKSNECPKVVATAYHNNPQATYDFVKLDQPIVKNYTELVDGSKVDYNIPRDEDAIKKGFTDDLPISFLSIKEGEIEKGTAWYQNRFDKLPPEMASLLARYNWGDLKYQTKKKIKNDKKKALKKGKNYEPIAFSVKQGKYFVNFD